MSRIVRYMSRLNWWGFCLILGLCALGAASNEHIVTPLQWSGVMLFFGLPVAVFFLLEGGDHR